ncbi:DUF917 domain-containing protein [Prauserella endophytica]|uniref:DUF917 domain-containing protein n=1 Tax=Prauserella endophytica TaxID=1592324 RepID=UPI0013051360|nr:DUF917 domain-containing protein [Prauserella endophytica]
MNAVTAEDLPTLAAGAHLLASGAGRTDVDGVLHWLSALLTEHGPVPLVQPDELAPDTACAAIGLVGSVTALAELPMVGDEPLQVVRALEARLGTKLGAVAALDAATANALTPVAAAASLGLPLVDCDGMGRVFPLIHQTSFALAGVSLTPLAAVGATGDTLILDATPERAERLLRAAVNVSGGWMLTAMYPTTTARLPSAGIVGSISRAIAVGRALLDATDTDDLAIRLKAQAGSRVLGTGRVVELEHRTRPADTGHPAYPSSIVVRSHAEPVRLIRLEAQNELLLALVDGAVAAAVPDIICLLDPHDGHVIDVESVTVGSEVQVVVVPAADVWHTPQGLALVGPRSFGFPLSGMGRQGM